MGKRWYSCDVFLTPIRPFPFVSEDSTEMYENIVRYGIHGVAIVAKVNRLRYKCPIVFNTLTENHNQLHFEKMMDRFEDDVSFLVYSFPPQVGYMASEILYWMMNNWITDTRAALSLKIEKRMPEIKKIRIKLEKCFYSDLDLLKEYYEKIFEYLKCSHTPYLLFRFAITCASIEGLLLNENAKIEERLNIKSSFASQIAQK